MSPSDEDSEGCCELYHWEWFAQFLMINGPLPSSSSNNCRLQRGFTRGGLCLLVYILEYQRTSYFDKSERLSWLILGQMYLLQQWRWCWLSVNAVCLQNLCTYTISGPFQVHLLSSHSFCPYSRLFYLPQPIRMEHIFQCSNCNSTHGQLKEWLMTWTMARWTMSQSDIIVAKGIWDSSCWGWWDTVNLYGRFG